MIPFLSTFIEENWISWFDEDPPEHLDFVKIAGNQLADTRVIFLIFKDHERIPCLIGKIPKTYKQADSLRREFDALKQIWSISDVRFSVPRPIWFGELPVGTVYLESAIVGRLLGNMRSPWLRNDDFITRMQVKQQVSKSLEWLAYFHKQTATTRMAQENQIIKSLVLKSIKADYLSQEISKPYEEAAEWLAEKISRMLIHRELPLVCEHGDFWAGNIYRTREGISVIDWADAVFGRLPIYDAGFFVVSLSLGFAPKNGNKTWLFEELVLQNCWFSDLVKRELGLYFQELGLPPLGINPVLGLVTLRRSIMERSRNQSDTIYQQMFDFWMRAAMGD